MTNSNIDIDKAGWSFDNTYAKLPEDFLVKQTPIPVKSPEIIILNKDLSKDLGLDFTNIKEENLSQLFSGNLLPTGSESIAQAYAGHQFGHFTMLGDGRAVLMGEHVSKNGDRHDIQFKGSGKTPFSRSGDGRAALGPMLREYIISEAMHELGVPTTRSLAVVKTGENVIREIHLPGAILTRIAASHIRVGTFQYIAATQKEQNLKVLFDYVINRHYPNIKNSKNQALDLLKTIMNVQINLVINWMRIGFIHGVMNTDNVSICGETIDYGPCAFMDTYNPDTIFSSIDQQARYSFSNQPKIIKWNLARFAECIITLIDDNKDKAVEIATEVINSFERIYEEKWLNMMRDKLGLFGEHINDQILITELLKWMDKNKADYTNTFCFLMNEKFSDNEIYNDENFLIWKKRWKDRLELNNNNQEKYLKLMHSVNPIIIPRNHKVEEALTAANNGDLEVMNKLLAVLKKPYESQNSIIDFQSPAPSSDKAYQTFCGT
ncbi:YdiU family protein [Candidatus Pelagibacter giovannonii]|uniref:Protein nucleotidyltransferase YdiU n=1 Tax=Candidatus Pelagibacter giovannonii TaxID=2563896 RepID=A0A6H1Q1A1_9PROT|nr:YdiU family protein [Candidatus Pelagibacter giovannonii]QIZ20692.1 YdiU family protein [Candidatus Pelagibacter giovannonii]